MKLTDLFNENSSLNDKLLSWSIILILCIIFSALFLGIDFLLFKYGFSYSGFTIYLEGRSNEEIANFFEHLLNVSIPFAFFSFIIFWFVGGLIIEKEYDKKSNKPMTWKKDLQICPRCGYHYSGKKCQCGY